MTKENQLLEIHAKALSDELTNALNVLIDLPAIQTLVNKFIQKNYEQALEKAEVKFNINFTRNERTIRHLQTATFENIKGITAELTGRLRRELSTGLAAGESRQQIRQRIRDVFRGEDSTTRFRFEDRIEMIRRTETIRAENFAQLDAARQIPIEVKKKVKIVMDARTSPICRAMHQKYGTNKKAIDTTKPFKVRARVGKKTVRVEEMAPPFHVNCRTSIQLVPQDEEDE